MTRVQIPFLPRFKRPMLDHTKTMTTRRKKYGNVGDTFEAFGATFEITEVGKLRLHDIANFWKEEGMESLDDFVTTWMMLHPYKPLDYEKQFYYHKFRKLIDVPAKENP